MNEPIVTFFRLYPNAPEPTIADNSALGTLPTRAYRYCEAVRLATGFGWLLYPPRDMTLRWDGNSDVELFLSENGGWHSLGLEKWTFDPEHEFFENCAPADLHGQCPPVITGLPEHGTVQIGIGWVAQTAPEWSLLIRGAPNLTTGSGFTAYEGIIEPDVQIISLFVNIRVSRTNSPVHLCRDWPLAIATPLRRDNYQPALLKRFENKKIEEIQWEMLHPTLKSERGDYARSIRKRRSKEAFDQSQFS